MIHSIRKYVVMILPALMACGSAMAGLTNVSSVLDGSGTFSSGGSLTNISAAGQPGGIAVSTGGTYVNQAGFLNTFLLKPDLDTDGDGITDELDQDNDGDGLTDTAEIGGGNFSPATPTDVNNPDTDGDSVSDGAEAVAGTNPDDIDAFLRITSISALAGTRYVYWVGRSNKTYRLLASSDPQSVPTNVIWVITASGTSSPPWHVQTLYSFDFDDAYAAGVYAVEVLP